MTDRAKPATPASEAALEALIRQTASSLGDVDAAVLPHMVKERLKAQLGPDVDVAAVLRAMKREQR